MIYTIIPVFNRGHHIKTCLTQLRSQICSIPQTVIVVDDGSTDGTSEMIRDLFPETVLIEGQGDWYWTGSVYQGVERALALSESEDDYFFVLNDDLEFDVDLLQRLYDFIQKNPRSIVQALGSWTDHREIVHYAGVKINRWTARRTELCAGERIDSFPPEHVVKVDALTGRGVLFPCQVFKEVGNYDRRIVHRGDPELTQRALKAGWNLLVYFGAIVYSVPVVGNGNINERKTYRLSDMREYYLGVLSSAHIPTLWRNSCSYTYSRFQAVVFFSFHLAGMTWNYLKRLRILNRR